MSISQTKTLTFLTIALVGTTTICLVSEASAQTQQTLGQCVKELREQGIYGSGAADRCEKLLQIQAPVQTLGQCIAELREQGIYGSGAADRCQRLLSTQAQNQNQTPPRTPLPSVVPTPLPSVVPGGSPQGIVDCMNKLLYEQKKVCTRGYCSPIALEAQVEGFGGWQTQTVRTETSEVAAAQACQNAR